MSAIFRKNYVHRFVGILRQRVQGQRELDNVNKVRYMLNITTRMSSSMKPKLDNVVTDNLGITSAKVDVNGVKLHYETAGAGKHVVLLLPGALGSTRTDFGPQLEKLNRDKYTVVAWDPRGYGKSIPPARDWPLMFLQRDADDAASLMETLGYKIYSLLGWSDGGITAMILAAKYPKNVNTMVIWGSNAFVHQKDMEIFTGVKDIDNWSDRMRTPFLEVYGEEYFRTQWGNWVDAYSAYYTQNKGDICKDDLKNIVCPSYMLHGNKDPMVPQYHPDYLKEHIKNLKVHYFPDGKHNIHLRYADEFNTLVSKFLDEHT